MTFFAGVARTRKEAANSTWFDGKLSIWNFGADGSALELSRWVPWGERSTSKCCWKIHPCDRHQGSALNTTWWHIPTTRQCATPCQGRWSAREWGWLPASPQPASIVPASYSPDFSVLALYYFRSILILQHEVASRSYDEFKDAVEKSFIGTRK